MSSATCNSATPVDGTEEAFRELERRRTAALVQRDLPTIERLHAPDYELITPSGKVFSRQAYIAAIAAEPFYQAWQHGPMAVRVSPAMALVRYQALLTFPSGRRVACWHTDAYALDAGAWQAVWSQATELALQRSVFAEPA